MAKFEVQQFTLCDGWINTWLNWDNNGDVTPDIFNSYADASMALDEFLDDMLYEFNQGNIESMYERDEYRIMEVEGVLL